jgi:hypothetical protein
MSLEEVERLAERPVQKVSHPWATHVIREDGETTQVWFIFKENKLQSVQLAWMYRLKRFATNEGLRLCVQEPERKLEPTLK